MPGIITGNDTLTNEREQLLGKLQAAATAQDDRVLYIMYGYLQGYEASKAAMDKQPA